MGSQSTNVGEKRKAPKIRLVESPQKKAKAENPKPIICKKKPSPTKQDLKKKIKTLQQKVRRKEKKIMSMNNILHDLQKKNLINEDVTKTLEKSFSGLSLEIIQNHYKNKDR